MKRGIFLQIRRIGIRIFQMLLSSLNWVMFYVIAFRGFPLKLFNLILGNYKVFALPVEPKLIQPKRKLFQTLIDVKSA
jgi:hypothetical protein